MIFRDDLTDEIEVELIDYGVAQSLHGIVGGDQYLKSPHHFGTKGTLQIFSSTDCILDISIFALSDSLSTLSIDASVNRIYCTRTRSVRSL